MSEARIDRALDLVAMYGEIDGAHHKQWLLDQMVRALTGDEYDRWVQDYEEADPSDGLTYIWDKGIAP